VERLLNVCLLRSIIYTLSFSDYGTGTVELLREARERHHAFPPVNASRFSFYLQSFLAGLSSTVSLRRVEIRVNVVSAQTSVAASRERSEPSTQSEDPQCNHLPLRRVANMTIPKMGAQIQTTTIPTALRFTAEIRSWTACPLPQLLRRMVRRTGGNGSIDVPPNSLMLGPDTTRLKWYSTQ
jgi:hypothetical protein